MLFNIGLAAAAVLWPLILFLAYRIGLRDGQRLEKGMEIKPLPSAPKRPAGPGMEDRRLQALMDNINAYDGTERGQQDIT